MAGYEQLTREELLVVVREHAGVIAELRQANEVLVERVRRLERLVSRNSGNSSMPPSSDDVAGRSKPASKRTSRSGRSRGKQPGAGGSALSWVADPDVTVPHRPGGRCGCGADLAGATDVRIERSHQVHDLPEIEITVTQHDVYRVRCGCGAVRVGALPDQVSAAPSSYGVNLKALVVYLIVFQHVPIERCVRLIADLTGGTAPSTGFAHAMLSRCAEALTDVITTIKTVITAAAVAGFDETTLRVGPAGKKKYVLSASTDTAVAFYLGGRDLGTFEAFGILSAFAGIAVHDRYAVYDNPRWANIAGHQACTAHLLRDFHDAAETYPALAWPLQAQHVLRALILPPHRRRALTSTDITKVGITVTSA